MKLSQAASFYARTSVSGWDGESWVPNISKLAILPSDRFISIHEFDTNCNYALVPIDDMGLDKYSVVKVEATGQVFLVGFKTNDVQQDVYSKFYLLRRAESLGSIYVYSKTLAASGIAKNVTLQLVTEVHCDVQHVTSTPSRKFPDSKFSDSMLFLPSDCDLQSDNEIKVGEIYYDVKIVYEGSGFKMCRATGRRLE